MIPPLLAARLQDIGCLACRKEGWYAVPSDLHHPTSGGRRVSDSTVIPLCPWHHRGEPMLGFGFQQMEQNYGPSLKLTKRAFVERYGSEMELYEWCQKLLRERFGD